MNPTIGLTPPTPPVVTPLYDDAVQVIHAAEVLGLQVEEVRLVADRRTKVYRVTVASCSGFHLRGTGAGLPPGSTGSPGSAVLAARVVAIEDSLTPSAVTHRVAYRLAQLGAPVAAPIHQCSVATEVGQVGFWPWLGEASIDAGTWGHLTGAFHHAGRRLPPELASEVGRYDPGRVFGPRLRRARELTASRGHPLHGQGAVVRRFEAALARAVPDAIRAAARELSPVLIHGDNQPGNVMLGDRTNDPAGPVLNDLVLNDLERLAIGPAAVDMAALVLGVQHYGYPPGVVEDFRAGYATGFEQEAPSRDEAAPFARVRELSGVVVAMLGAGDSPDAEREMRVRVAAIEVPGAGEAWTYLGHPDATRLTAPAPIGTGDE